MADALHNRLDMTEALGSLFLVMAEWQIWETILCSLFLDFVASDTFATADYPGSFMHYEVLCSDLVIDVAAEQLPRMCGLERYSLI